MINHLTVFCFIHLPNSLCANVEWHSLNTTLSYTDNDDNLWASSIWWSFMLMTLLLISMKFMCSFRSFVFLIWMLYFTETTDTFIKSSLLMVFLFIRLDCWISFLCLLKWNRRHILLKVTVNDELEMMHLKNSTRLCGSCVSSPAIVHVRHFK